MKTYFENLNLNYAPIVEAVLRNPSGSKSARVKLIIDTGFQGGVLLPLHMYVDLRLYLFEKPHLSAITATGNRVVLRVSEVIVELGGLTVRCHAYTALGVRRSLLGREVLKEVGFLYNPPGELKLGIKKL